MPNIIMNGSKIISLVFRKIKIIDSVSFIPMPLDKFSKTFGIKELSKGFFPHEFNKLENQNYVGPWPDKSYYGVKFMNDDKKFFFDKWYDENANKSVFDFKKEILKYCISDVDLLMKGCLSFRDNLMQITKMNRYENDPLINGIDPFLCATTAASLCQFVFNNIFLNKEEIAIIPQNGYHKNQNHSIKAIQWLEFLSKKKNIKILHARNSGEVKVGEFFVDGFDPLTNTVYNFDGDFFHGCPICYKDNTFNVMKQKTMGQIYKDHLRKTEKLKNSKYNNMPIKLVQIWEHTFDDMCRNDDELKIFLKDFELTAPMNVRDSFFGGRTEVFLPYYNAKEDEKIFYYDYCSLYPSVQAHNKFPIGHPEILTSNFTNINDYFGIAKVKVLAPRGLYIPVLPMRLNGKLLFALCKKCSENKTG